MWWRAAASADGTGCARAQTAAVSSAASAAAAAAVCRAQVAKGVAYPCFCTDEELEAMKKDAEEKKLPPIYR